MNDSAPSHEYAVWIRDFANLVNRVFTRGAETVADEMAEHVPETADPTSVPGRLRWLLLAHAHLFAHTRDRTEVASTLHGVLVSDPKTAAWPTGVDEVLPSLRLAERGGDAAPVDARLLRVLTGHRAPVSSLAWSPDGGSLATVGAYDASLRIWDARTWREERCLNVSGAVLGQVEWSPDGRRLAVLGKSDRFSDLGDDVDDEWGSRVELVHVVLVYDTTTWREVAVTPTAPDAATGNGRSSLGPLTPGSSPSVRTSACACGRWTVTNSLRGSCPMTGCGRCSTCTGTPAELSRPWPRAVNPYREEGAESPRASC